MEAIKLKLDNFEGPLDLLLHLLQKKELTIEEIEISKLIDEYLHVISEAKRDSLNIKVEFLIIASELLEIKALSILSMREKEKREEELSKRLKEYKFFKEISEKLKEMERVYNKPYSLGEGRRIVKTASKEFDIRTLTLEGIFKAYSKYIEAEEKESLYINIEQKFSIKEEIEGIQTFVKKARVSIGSIFERARSRMHLVYIFLAVLELYKSSSIVIEESELKFV